MCSMHNYREQQERAQAARAHAGTVPLMASKSWLRAPLYRRPQRAGEPSVRQWVQRSSHAASIIHPIGQWYMAANPLPIRPDGQGGLPTFLDRDIVCAILMRHFYACNGESEEMEMPIGAIRDLLLPQEHHRRRDPLERICYGIERIHNTTISWGNGTGPGDEQGTCDFNAPIFSRVRVPSMAKITCRRGIGEALVRIKLNPDFLSNMMQPHEWQFFCFQAYLNLATQDYRAHGNLRQIYLYLASHVNQVVQDKKRMEFVCDLDDLIARYEHAHNNRRRTDGTEVTVPRYNNVEHPSSQVGIALRILEELGLMPRWQVGSTHRGGRILEGSLRSDWGTKVGFQTRFLEFAPGQSRHVVMVTGVSYDSDADKGQNKKPGKKADGAGLLGESQEKIAEWEAIPKAKSATPGREEGQEPRDSLHPRVRWLIAQTGVFTHLVEQALAQGWTVRTIGHALLHALYEKAVQPSAERIALGSIAGQRLKRDPSFYAQLLPEVKQWAQEQPWWEDFLRQADPADHPLEQPSAEPPVQPEAPLRAAADQHPPVEPVISAEEQVQQGPASALNQDGALSWEGLLDVMRSQEMLDVDARPHRLWLCVGAQTLPLIIENQGGIFTIVCPTSLFADRMQAYREVLTAAMQHCVAHMQNLEITGGQDLWEALRSEQQRSSDNV